MLDTIQFSLRYFVTMFVVASPLAIIALFVSMTASYTVSERVAAAKMACLVAFGVVEFFVLFGRRIFEFFGISVGSFYIAGGMLVFLVGLDMLRGQDSDEHISDGEVEDSKAAARKKKDISITPLGIPMIAGPCLITCAIAQQAKASNFLECVGGFIAAGFVIFVMYIVLSLSARGAKWLTPTVLKLSYRLSGLILAALAIEMVVTGIKSDDLGLWTKKQEGCCCRCIDCATSSAEGRR
jgi:multiple antibiotic resistance protein